MVYKHYKAGYYVSDKGKVKRLRNGKKCEVKILTSKAGYLYFHMFSCKENVFIHKAVAHLFLEKIQGKWIIDHIDRNKQNNNIQNLRYVNHSENMQNRDKWSKNNKNNK